MLDMRWIRENPEALDEALQKRGAPPAAQKLIEADEARRTHIHKLQEAQERRNAASKEIGKAKATGDEETAKKLIDEVAELKSFLQTAEETGRGLDSDLDDMLSVLPNVPMDDVPVGEDEDANVTVRTVGDPKQIENAKEHFELGEALGMMDFERAATISGSRFVVLSGQLARLERALGQFMIDLFLQ